MSCPLDLTGITTAILDIDGVLTDGRIGYHGDDGDEIKFFDVKDGHSIKLARRAGLRVGALTGRESRTNARRARELELDFLYQGATRKIEVFPMLLKDVGVTADQCFYLGDDVIDLPVMRQCGGAAAVADAVPEVRERVKWVTQACGGRGAVREVLIEILRQQDLLDGVLARYF